MHIFNDKKISFIEMAKATVSPLSVQPSNWQHHDLESLQDRYSFDRISAEVPPECKAK